jgi:hypothetical protein
MIEGDRTRLEVLVRLLDPGVILARIGAAGGNQERSSRRASEH